MGEGVALRGLRPLWRLRRPRHIGSSCDALELPAPSHARTCKRPPDPARRCKRCQGSKKQCGRCAGTVDSHAARKRRQEEEETSRVPDPLLDRERKRNREADSNRRAAAKALSIIPTRDLCRGVDSLTGKQCTRRQCRRCSIDGSPRCTECYKAAKGQEAYTTLLRERHDALPQCVGTRQKRHGLQISCLRKAGHPSGAAKDRGHRFWSPRSHGNGSQHPAHRRCVRQLGTVRMVLQEEVY